MLGIIYKRFLSFWIRSWNGIGYSLQGLGRFRITFGFWKRLPAQRRPSSVSAVLRYGAGGCDPKQCLVIDASESPNAFQLHECGFQLEKLDHYTFEIAWDNRAVVASEVYPVAEQAACRAAGAAVALAFDHRVRCSNGIMEKAPVMCVHTDIVLGKAPYHIHALLQTHLQAALAPSDANEVEEAFRRLLDDRVAFVNVWLPTSELPVARDPLAVCDWRSRPKDLSDWNGSEVEYSPAHEWFYFSGLSAGDALVLKQWDSHSAACRSDQRDQQVPSTPAREALHTAFTLPNTSNASLRKSCEVRVLLLFGTSLPSAAAESFRESWRQVHPPEYNIFV